MVNRWTHNNSGQITFLRDETYWVRKSKKDLGVLVKNKLRGISKRLVQTDRLTTESLQRMLKKLKTYLIEERVSKIIIRGKNIMIQYQVGELCTILSNTNCMELFMGWIVANKTSTEFSHKILWFLVTQNKESSKNNNALKISPICLNLARTDQETK